jgi:phosphoglycolate phosphatase-like HAD superfamily hydrolase
VLLPSSMSCWGFDIDGVLADTREAVVESYRLAGVEQPADAWGISWKLWLPELVGDRAAEVHVAKQYEYARLLERGAVQRLPGADMAEALLAYGHLVFFVTAASEQSAHAVLRALTLPVTLLWEAELLRDRRVAELINIRKWREASSYTYVDDREEGANIAAEAGWTFTHARWTQ